MLFWHLFAITRTGTKLNVVNSRASIEHYGIASYEPSLSYESLPSILSQYWLR